MRSAMLVAAFCGLMTATGAALAQDVVKKASQPAERTPQKPDSEAAYEQTLADAEALVKSGKPGEAYDLLEPLEFVHAGEERFDYLIGIAALDSGQPAKATFALERVLTVNPNSAAARLDMARAYYQLGDMPRAKAEFLIVLNQDIPAEARTNIEKYLDEIAARESGSQTRLSGYIEGALGHDSNVNTSTSQTQILVNAIPVGPITLDQANIGKADAYRGMAAGGEVRHNLNDNWEMFVAADWKKRNYSTQNQFDALDMGARAGVMYGAQAERFSVNVSSGRNNLGGLHNYDTTGINGEWRHVFSPANQANVSLLQAKYRYADVLMKPYDIDQQAIGVGWLHVLVDGKTSLSGNLYQGTEKDVSTVVTAYTPNGGRMDGAKRFSGFRIGGQTELGGKTSLYANAGVQVGNYDRVNPLFLLQRKDRFSDLTAGLNWNFARLWALRPQINYSKNDSNIVIYSYTRKDVSLTVRRDFR